MSDLLFGIGVTKLALSLGLAGVALIIQKRVDRPPVSHALWALVLGVLLVPAVVPTPLPELALPWLSSTGPARGGGAATAPPVGDVFVSGWPGGWPGTLKAALVLTWLLGAAAILVWSVVRTVRFRRLLIAASRPAGPELRRQASSTASALGLRRVPTVEQTRAQLSPMVWWTGGEVRVLIPDALVCELDAAGLRWVLAHEMAHVRRADHVIRWLEWLACALFWWNPVAWWTRRQLRAAEEFCCDALVLSALGASPQSYGSSLVSVIDYLSTPATLRPPAFASAVDNGGRTTLIERRLRKIMTRKTILNTPRWLRVTLVIAGAGALSLGLINCGADANPVGPALEETDQAFAEVDAARHTPSARVEFDHSVLKDAECADCHVAGKAEFADQEALVRATAAQIREALAAGELSPDEAELRLRELDARAQSMNVVEVKERAGVVRHADGIADQSVKAAVEKIRAAVQAGEITDGQARDRLRELEGRVRQLMVEQEREQAARAGGEEDVSFGVLRRTQEPTDAGQRASGEARRKIEQAARGSSGN